MYWRSCTCNTRTVVLGTYAPEGLLAVTRADARVRGWSPASGRAARDKATYVKQARCPCIVGAHHGSRNPFPRTECHRRPQETAEVDDRGPSYRVIRRSRRCTTAAAHLDFSAVCEAPAPAAGGGMLSDAFGHSHVLAHSLGMPAAWLAGGVGTRKHDAIDGQRRSLIYGVYLSSVNTMDA